MQRRGNRRHYPSLSREEAMLTRGKRSNRRKRGDPQVNTSSNPFCIERRQQDISDFAQERKWTLDNSIHTLSKSNPLHHSRPVVALHRMQFRSPPLSPTDEANGAQLAAEFHALEAEVDKVRNPVQDYLRSGTRKKSVFERQSKTMSFGHRKSEAQRHLDALSMRTGPKVGKASRSKGNIPPRAGLVSVTELKNLLYTKSTPNNHRKKKSGASAYRQLNRQLKTEDWLSRPKPCIESDRPRNPKKGAKWQTKERSWDSTLFDPFRHAASHRVPVSQVNAVMPERNKPSDTPGFGTLRERLDQTSKSAAGVVLHNFCSEKQLVDRVVRAEMRELPTNPNLHK